MSEPLTFPWERIKLNERTAQLVALEAVFDQLQRVIDRLNEMPPSR